MNTNSSERKKLSSLNDKISEISHKKHKDEPQNILSLHAKSDHQFVDQCKKTSMEHEENDVRIIYENNYNG